MRKSERRMKQWKLKRGTARRKEEEEEVMENEARKGMRRKKGKWEKSTEGDETRENTD